MKYTISFASLALLCLAIGALSHKRFGLAALACLYPALVLLWLARIYFGGDGQRYGKSPEGRYGWWYWPLYAPWLIPNAIVFRLYQLLVRQSTTARITDGLYLGRWLSDRDVVEAKMPPLVGVLDLAGEFPESSRLRAARHYLSLPLLDGSVPRETDLYDAVAWLEHVVPQGPVYVHCALGHTRSATVVVAYLLATNECCTIREAEDRVRAVRPGVRLSRHHRERIEGFLTLLRHTETGAP